MFCRQQGAMKCKYMRGREEKEGRERGGKEGKEEKRETEKKQKIGPSNTPKATCKSLQEEVEVYKHVS
jgi:hypothetical protein